MLEAEYPLLKEKSQDLTFAHISQLEAAPFVLKTIQDLKNNLGEKEGHEAVYDTDVISLRRGLCLPAATCASLNGLYGERKFDEKSIAAMYQELIPLHGSRANDPQTGQPYPNGWKVVTKEGDMYYHAIAYWVKKITLGEITPYSVVGYENLQAIAKILASTQSSMALSLDNKFVLDWVTKVQQMTNIEFITKNSNGDVFFNGGELGQKPFQNGRHVVSVLDYREQNNSILISDSFTLPRMKTEHTLRWWPISEIEQYTHYQSGLPPRALFLTKDAQIHPNFENVIGKYSVPVSVPLLS